MSKIQSHPTARNPLPPARRRKSGRNRLRACLRDELVGEKNSVMALPDDSPRKRPTLPHIHFLEGEDVQS